MFLKRYKQNQHQGNRPFFFFFYATGKFCRGHIAFTMSVTPSLRQSITPSVRHTFCFRTLTQTNIIQSSWNFATLFIAIMSHSKFDNHHYHSSHSRVMYPWMVNFHDFGDYRTLTQGNFIQSSWNFGKLFITIISRSRMVTRAIA